MRLLDHGAAVGARHVVPLQLQSVSTLVEFANGLQLKPVLQEP